DRDPRLRRGGRDRRRRDGSPGRAGGRRDRRGARAAALGGRARAPARRGRPSTRAGGLLGGDGPERDLPLPGGARSSGDAAGGRRVEARVVEVPVEGPVTVRRRNQDPQRMLVVEAAAEPLELLLGPVDLAQV